MEKDLTAEQLDWAVAYLWALLDGDRLVAAAVAGAFEDSRAELVELARSRRVR